MKTQKLKLNRSRILKVYNYGQLYIGSETTSTTGDPTTLCTTVTSSTHVLKS